MLDKASGTETPAATNVKPITVSGIPIVLPLIQKIIFQIAIFKKTEIKFYLLSLSSKP